MKIKIKVRRGKGAVAAVADTTGAPAAATVAPSIDKSFMEGF